MYVCMYELECIMHFYLYCYTAGVLKYVCAHYATTYIHNLLAACTANRNLYKRLKELPL